MIKLNLKQLMADNKINVTELSQLTGISRSTITPLVKDPDNVLSVKLETINILCEFFGVSNIDQLVSFQGSKRHYAVLKVWDGSPQFVMLDKKIGTKSRKTLLAVNCDFIPIDSNDVDTNFFARFEFEALDPKEAHKTKGFEKDTSIVDGDLFVTDLKRQTKDNIQQTTEIILQALIDSSEFKNRSKNLNISGIEASWHFASLLERSQYTFRFDFENNILTAQNI